METVINTISQKIVPPSQIETELFQIWDSLTKEDKVRASLFNLIVVTPLNDQYDDVRKIVQKLIEKFPCRIVFITLDIKEKKPYYKSAVSVVFPDESEPCVACDYIDIALAGTDIKKTSYLILPHLLPDMPIYLFWPQNEKKYLSILKELSSFVHRIIFNSECFDKMDLFASFIIKTREDFPRVDIADLKWIQMEGYKQCLSSEFHSKTRFEKLQQASNISIYYSLGSSPAKDQIQSIYLQGWLASVTNRSFVKIESKDHITKVFYTPDLTFELIGQKEEICFGSIIKVVIQTQTQEVFAFSRNIKNPQSLKIDIENPTQCELPYYYIMGKEEAGLSNEITSKGTSSHFLKTLTYIKL